MLKVKRIIILTNTLKSGGAEKQSILLAKALKSEYPTCLIVYYGNEFDERLKRLADASKINIFWLKGGHLRKLIWLYTYFKREKETAVFSYLATTNIINGIIGSLAKVKYKVGGIRSSKLSPVKMFFQRYLHNYAFTKTICNNAVGLSDLSHKGFNNDKFKLIHNGIELSPYKKKLGLSKRTIIILTVGRFVPEKDITTAILSIADLAKRLRKHPTPAKIKYIIVGYGDLEQKIRTLVSQLNMEEIAEIVINPHSVKTYFQLADIYLSTSLFEGLSNSIMEAMECYLPIVATAVGDNNQLVQDGENGFLVDIKNYRGLSSALLEIVMNCELRKKMGENSRKLLEDKFSLEVFKRNYVDFINELS